MPKTINSHKGLDIKLIGTAYKKITETKLTETYAVKPTDFRNITPKLSVKPGARLKAGSALFFDKYKPEILFTSPVSGELIEVKRGERRKILEFIIKADSIIEYEEFPEVKTNSHEKEIIINNLLKSGLWTKLKQRPFDILADFERTPKAIHISTFDSAPLAPDYNFILNDEINNFQKGVDILGKLTSGKIYVNTDAKLGTTIFDKIKNAEITSFKGPHPIGNAGIQIHHLTPINKGDIVWYINPQDVVMIGRFFTKGVYDASKIIALAGSEVKEPQYYKVITGFNVSELIKQNVASNYYRIISGNVLTGIKILPNGFIGALHDQISVIPEGDHYEMLGWALPGLRKMSTSRTFISWLTPNRQYKLDTNFNGSKRAFVVTGLYEKLLPMDILPLQLFKAILAEDVELMENLGIYEVAEEDFALCEYACTSKTEIQEIISKGIDLMIKEMN